MIISTIVSSVLPTVIFQELELKHSIAAIKHFGLTGKVNYSQRILSITQTLNLLMVVPKKGAKSLSTLEEDAKDRDLAPFLEICAKVNNFLRLSGKPPVPQPRVLFLAKRHMYKINPLMLIEN